MSAVLFLDDSPTVAPAARPALWVPDDLAGGPPVTRRRTATPADRTSAEISAERVNLIAEADRLLGESRQRALTEDESARLESVVSQAEQLEAQLPLARQRERAAGLRQRMQEPTRPAPAFNPAQAAAVAGGAGGPDQAEALQLWMRSVTNSADNSADARYRAAQAGFQIGSSSIRVGCNYGGTLNRVKRRALSRPGVGTGKELVPSTVFSDKVTEYLSYFSPFLTMVDSDVTADGNDRDYPRVDDTALISTRITASGGTETAPNVPDADVATGTVKIKAYEITSGYHKLTPQILRDSPIMLADKVSRGIGNSHARRMERDSIIGDGVNEAQGVLTASTVYGAAVADIDQDLLEALYFSVPEAYRGGCIWLVSTGGKQRMRKKLKDSTGRSLFGKSIDEGIEVETLFERPVYTSEYMPAYGANAKPIMFFHPMFYLLRLVEGQQLDLLTEKFHPLLAYVGMMAFGGAWLGPAAANKCIQLTGTPTP